MIFNLLETRSIQKSTRARCFPPRANIIRRVEVNFQSCHSPIRIEKYFFISQTLLKTTDPPRVTINVISSIFLLFLLLRRNLSKSSSENTQYPSNEAKWATRAWIHWAAWCVEIIRDLTLWSVSRSIFHRKNDAVEEMAARSQGPKVFLSRHPHIRWRLFLRFARLIPFLRRFYRRDFAAGASNRPSWRQISDNLTILFLTTRLTLLPAPKKIEEEIRSKQASKRIFSMKNESSFHGRV